MCWRHVSGCELRIQLRLATGNLLYPVGRWPSSFADAVLFSLMPERSSKLEEATVYSDVGYHCVGRRMQSQMRHREPLKHPSGTINLLNILNDCILKNQIACIRKMHKFCWIIYVRLDINTTGINWQCLLSWLYVTPLAGGSDVSHRPFCMGQTGGKQTTRAKSCLLGLRNRMTATCVITILNERSSLTHVTL